MIPEHLKGKSATQICSMAGKRCESKGLSLDEYTIHIEQLLLLAVRDALDNIKDDDELSYGDGRVSSRAIVFLNRVLPKE